MDAKVAVFFALALSTAACGSAPMAASPAKPYTELLARRPALAATRPAEVALETPREAIVPEAAVKSYTHTSTFAVR